MGAGRPVDRRAPRLAARAAARRSGMVVALLVISSCGITSNSAPSATPATPVSRGPARTPSATAAPAPAGRVSVLTALGDSVPFGTACDCTPYPQLTAAHIAQTTHHTVDSFNDAVGGSVSGDVVRQLHNDAGVIDDVERADVVMIEVGANDIAFSPTCGTQAACYARGLPHVTANITAIVGRVRALTAGRHVDIVLLDYWSVWLGGRYAQARGTAYVDAATSLTDVFSDALESVAASTGAIYVNLRTAFLGPRNDADDTGLLAGDGDHPNAAGQARIATTILSNVALA